MHVGGQVREAVMIEFYLWVKFLPCERSQTQKGAAARLSRASSLPSHEIPTIELSSMFNETIQSDLSNRNIAFAESFFGPERHNVLQIAKGRAEWADPVYRQYVVNVVADLPSLERWHAEPEMRAWMLSFDPDDIEWSDVDADFEFEDLPFFRVDWDMRWPADNPGWLGPDVSLEHFRLPLLALSSAPSYGLEQVRILYKLCMQ